MTLPEHDMFMLPMDDSSSESSESSALTSCLRRRRGPISPKSSSQPRFVSFNEQVHVQYVDRIADILEQDYITDASDIWMTSEEIRDIKHRSEELVYCLESGISFDEEEDCIRGLEGKLQVLKRKRRRVRAEAYETVFMEQEQQREEGEVDPEGIAMFYRDMTVLSQTEAYKRAAQDRVDALSC
jgi:hypothetical protein